MKYILNDNQKIIFNHNNLGVKFVVDGIIDELIESDYYFYDELRGKEDDLITYVNSNLDEFLIEKQINRGNITACLNKIFPNFKDRIRKNI